MNFLAVAALYTLFFVLLTYVVLVGGSKYHRSGLVGWLRTLIFKACSMVKSMLICCVPICIIDAGDYFVKYLLFTRNPFVQIFYCILMAGGTSIITFKILPHFDSFNIYGALAYVFIVINFGFFAICSYKDPGVITRENVLAFSRIYEPDGWFYFEQQCSTCEIVKPARSKHCSICDVCVGRFDHHCSWVNNCIGQRNYKYFLGFIATTAVMCLYLTFIIMVVFVYIVLSQGLHVSYYIDSQGNRQPASFNILAQYLLSKHTLVSILFMTVLLFGVLMTGFTVFHAYLVCTNQTTNELFKRCRGLEQGSSSANNEVTSRPVTAGRLKTLKVVRRSTQPTESVKETKRTDARKNLTPYYRGIFQNIFEVFAT